MEIKLIAGICFSDNGKKIIERLKQEDSSFIVIEKDEEDLSDFVKFCFRAGIPMVFVGAAGIAVRAIAEYVKSKLEDSPVIVIDELGINVIPILSGHFGGANELAREIAKLLGANPVITTATDINNVFSVDDFARINGLRIPDKKGILPVAKAALAGEEIRIVSEGLEFSANGLRLIPKTLVLGLGCKRDKGFDELLEYVLKFYDRDYLKENLYAICSIDVKKDELGLAMLANYFGAKFLVFSDSELMTVTGDFTESEFVKSKVGVASVCERAACLGAGLLKRKLELEKKAESGITIAAARRENIKLSYRR